MESLETAAAARSSDEGHDGNVVSKREIPSEEAREVETKTKGWHRQLEEGRSEESFEDQSSMHQDYEANPLQSTNPFPIGRQKAATFYTSTWPCIPQEVHQFT
ncbi:hypothetical protein KUCAC02_034392 [Chaenocephalus aceratus]|nr:hypothetical protein KUCAC02_034392 [Chaenocephalus aceratus]